MRLSYKVSEDKVNEEIKFPLGHFRGGGLHIGSSFISGSAQLSNAQVLAILSEVVTYSNAKIKIEFEDITLEFE
jgi:hypothetical protein